MQLVINGKSYPSLSARFGRDAILSLAEGLMDQGYRRTSMTETTVCLEG